jgi:hypothetical protein
MTGVVPPDDVVLVALIDPHLQDLALSRLLADVKAVNDELVSNLGMHGDLLTPDPMVRHAGVSPEGSRVTSTWD